MGSLTNYGENALMGHIFGSTYGPVATLYLALCTGDPGETATGASCSEVPNASAYQRTAISFGAAAARRITQSGAVTFPQASGAWGSITHWCIIDTQTYGSGNVLASGALAETIAPVNGNTPSIASGQVYVEISAGSGQGWTTQAVGWLLDLMFRNQAYSQPATYVALLDGAGADADTTLTTKEVSGTSYARKLVNKAGGSSPAWEAVSGGVTQNAAAITFTAVGAGAWGTIVAMAIVDAATLGTGNVLMYDNTNVVDQTPIAGDVVEFAAGALDVSLT